MNFNGQMDAMRRATEEMCERDYRFGFRFSSDNSFREHEEKSLEEENEETENRNDQADA